MRFNIKRQPKNMTLNLAGGEAYVQSPKLELVSLLLTSFAQGQYYRCADQTIERLKELVNAVEDKRFAAKAAVYARTEFGMRSISHVVASEIAKNVKGEQWTRRFFDRVVYRTDDITEILACYLGTYGKPVPNSLKDGLALAFGKFDCYQLAKYRAEKAEISLVDAVNLVRPVPNDRNREALRKLVKDELRSVGTWESGLTSAGQKAETDENKALLKADTWRELVSGKKIGYFALLRNLRNILEQAPDLVDKACEMLTDEKLIRSSLVLPFRYQTAINEIQKTNLNGVQKAIQALDKAVDTSLSNVPKLPGRTLVAVDGSGSMEGRPIEIASLFAAVLTKMNGADMIVFSDNARYFSVNTADTTMSIAKLIRGVCAFGGTNFHSIFEKANRKYDRIVILSDMQAWMGHHTPKKTFEAYKKKYDASPAIYSFDLAGHGTMQFPEDKVYCLAGFSEKVFDIMSLLERDKNALIEEIEKVEL